VVVVARHEHDLATRHRLAEILEHRPSGGERLAHRAMAELEHVAEQHQALDVPQSLEQRRSQRGAPQHVGAREAAEMQV
jgi:hypothetical protein